MASKKKTKAFLERKVISRKILKKNKAVVTIKEHKPAEYVSRFFKDEMGEAKKGLFF